jgi:hypothetical protein
VAADGPQLPALGRFARLHAWMTCQFAWLEVPAYRAFLDRSGWDFRWFRLDSYPPTDKQNYVRAFPEEQRCRGGELAVVGSVVDESSGSSGQPFNWVRSRRELRSVHKNLAGFTTMVFPSPRRFVINAYSDRTCARSSTRCGNSDRGSTTSSRPTRRSSSTCATCSTPSPSTGPGTGSAAWSAARG